MTDRTDQIIEAKPRFLLPVIEKMPALPWPEGDEWLEWTIDGFEGQTSWLMHVLPLALTSDPDALASFTKRLAARADHRWGSRREFDATRFTDDADTPAASYDRRSAVAGLVRSFETTTAVWWAFDGNAAVLLDGSTASNLEVYRAAMLVLPVEWLAEPGADEESLRSPLVTDFLSGDPSRIMHAVWEVFATRRPEILSPVASALPAIATATADVELGGALASNHDHLQHVLHRVELFQQGGCLCAAYPSHPFYDVAKEERRRHVWIRESLATEQQRAPDLICECRNCGRRYRVEQGEYHYPWWKWTALSES